jgi:hypothetical protein
MEKLKRQRNEYRQLTKGMTSTVLMNEADEYATEPIIRKTSIKMRHFPQN